VSASAGASLPRPSFALRGAACAVSAEDMSASVSALHAALGLDDLDGDDLVELLVGAPYADGGASNAGAVYLFAGSGLSGTVSASSALATIDGSSASDTVGTTTRRRSSHHPNPASAPPTIGPTARRIGLEPVTPSSRLPKL
jgi:hypothetical protein